MTLRRIRIQHLGVIEDAELDLCEGLNVITGETGAGKTMVVSGLGLLLGERADAGLVRSGAQVAVVEGEIEVSDDHPAARRVREAGGETDDGIVLVRSVAAQGRSRAHVGGRTAPVSVLSEVGESLVAVHGQADQWRLRDAEQHRLLVDSAGGTGIAACLRAYEEAFDQWRAAADRLQELSASSTDRAMRVAMLQAALEEIAAVDPQAGEEDELRVESERLAHAEELRTAAQRAHDALAGSESPEVDQAGVVQLAATAGSVLGTAMEHDPELGPLRQRLDEISYLASDLATEFASYAAGIEVDPQRLDWVHQRRAEISSLLRRFGSNTHEVLAFAETSAAELAQLDLSDDQLAELAAHVDELRRRVGQAGVALSTARAEVAHRVGEEVSAELAHLAMGSAELSIAVDLRQAEPEQPHSVPLPEGGHALARRHGLDEVEIRLAANPGAPPRSVTRAASGGELSRVMLALELVCGGAGNIPTYVFDEVDAGVGGSAALDLGARLSRLAQTAQVIVVTHLGQVAAYADRHLVVRKSTDGQVTHSGVIEVRGSEREAELARMLGGVADSDAAVQHARELLDRRGTMT